MAGRPKAASRELVSLDDANDAMRELLQAEIELGKQQGALDLARAQATAKFETGLDAQRSRIADLTIQLQTWYLTRAEKPEGAKSLQLAYGRIGERTGMPKLEPLNRKWNWKAICTKLRLEYGARFFNPAPEATPDKDRLRAELDADALKELGLKVSQEENFYIDLDRTTLGDAA